MKSNSNSNLPLSPEDMKLIGKLAKLLKTENEVDVVHRALRMLEDSVDRDHLQARFAKASIESRNAGSAYGSDSLDELAGEGLE